MYKRMPLHLDKNMGKPVTNRKTPYQGSTNKKETLLDRSSQYMPHWCHYHVPYHYSWCHSSQHDSWSQLLESLLSWALLAVFSDQGELSLTSCWLPSVSERCAHIVAVLWSGSLRYSYPSLSRLIRMLFIDLECHCISEKKNQEIDRLHSENVFLSWLDLGDDHSKVKT